MFVTRRTQKRVWFVEGVQVLWIITVPVHRFESIYFFGIPFAGSVAHVQ